MESIQNNRFVREPLWTESFGVWSKAFFDAVISKTKKGKGFILPPMKMANGLSKKIPFSTDRA
jgi:hypothetical protein